jgi:hypothetical protein
MPDPVTEFESLSRFVFDKRYIRPDNTLRHAAFMPDKKNRETSVFRISGVSEEQIWHIASEVATIRNKQLFGRADILASKVFSKELQVVPKEPPPNHANIVGWPDDPSLSLSIAQELADEATPHRVGK